MPWTPAEAMPAAVRIDLKMVWRIAPVQIGPPVNDRRTAGCQALDL
jgi:hypothetical protein